MLHLGSENSTPGVLASSGRTFGIADIPGTRLHAAIAEVRFRNELHPVSTATKFTYICIEDTGARVLAIDLRDAKTLSDIAATISDESLGQITFVKDGPRYTMLVAAETAIPNTEHNARILSVLGFDDVELPVGSGAFRGDSCYDGTTNRGGTYIHFKLNITGADIACIVYHTDYEDREWVVFRPPFLIYLPCGNGDTVNNDTPVTLTACDSRGDSIDGDGELSGATCLVYFKRR